MTETLVVAIAAVVAIAVATTIAPKIKVAGPLILVAVGIGVSLLPFVPDIQIDPEIILVGVLPPLLYSAAVSLPAIEFRRDLGHISGLAVALVVISSVALAFFFVAVIPGLSFFLALALGAILSPTDAVATSIAKRLGISRRVVTLLEGESLLNDATSLVIMRTAVAAALLGSVPDGGFVGAFVWGVIVAAAIGALIGYLNLRLRALVRHSAANTAIGFVAPFAAFIPTEELGGSGLVAAVVAGVVTGQGSVRWFTPEQRMSDALNWRTIELVLEGSVFLVMGLELSEIVGENAASDKGIWHGPMLAAIAFLIVLAVRAGYVTLLVASQGRRARDRRHAHLARLSEQVDRHADRPAHSPPHPRGSRRLARMLADLAYYRADPIGWRHGTVIVWAGMRGVVTLAAAQTLPRDTPERPLLIFVAFLVAVGSLMLQGLTLPWVVRMLKVDDAGEQVTRADQRRLDAELREAAASSLPDGDLVRQDGTPFPDGLLTTVGSMLTEPPDDATGPAARDTLELRLALIAVMRRRLDEVSTGGGYSTATLRHALAELDAAELSLQLRLDGQT